MQLVSMMAMHCIFVLLKSDRSITWRVEVITQTHGLKIKSKKKKKRYTNTEY